MIPNTAPSGTRILPHMHRLATLLLLLFLPACAAPRPLNPDEPTGLLFKSVESRTQPFQYVVYIPRSYNATTQDFPCILFLHGSGESGSDGQKQAVQGIGSAILWNAAKWPFIVIMPQKPDHQRQWEDYDSEVMACLNEVRRDYRIDRSRIYLTGLSQGGHGTWTIAASHPRTFAALAPICGYISTSHEGEPDTEEASRLATRLRHLPIWAFHGLADDVVLPVQTTTMIDALKAAGADPKLTLYPEVNHNAWDKAYRQEDLPTWFLEHHR